MKIALASTGQTLDAPIDDRFGRAAYFLLVDSDSMACEAFANPAADQVGGAGIAACQHLIQLGAQVVIAGQLGPNAMRVLQSAEIDLYQSHGQTGGDNIAAYLAGRLERLTQSGPAHAGGARS